MKTSSLHSKFYKRNSKDFNKNSLKYKTLNINFHRKKVNLKKSLFSNKNNLSIKLLHHPRNKNKNDQNLHVLIRFQ